MTSFKPHITSLIQDIEPALRRHMTVRKAIMMFAVLLALMPFVAAATHHVGNSALAAFEAGWDDDLQGMKAGDRLRYARSIRAGLDKDPEKFLNMTGADIRLAFAKPDLVRTEGNMQVLQFRTNDCVLDIYLSRREGRDEVVHYELRERGKAVLLPQDRITPEILNTQLCMQNVLAQSLPGKGTAVASLFGR